MNNYRNIGLILVSAAIVLLQGFVVSCAKVEFSGDSIENFEGAESLDQNRMSKISFEVSWPEDLPEEEKPEYVTVVMNRIQSIAARYIYILDKTGNIVKAITPPEAVPEEGGEQTPEEGEQPVPQNEDGTEEDASDEGVEEDDGRPAIHNGYYSVAAIACQGEESYSIPDLEKFAADMAVSMSSLYVTIPEISDAEKADNKYINFNPIYPYIEYTDPFYLVRPTMDSHVLISSGEKDNVIRLEPMLLTRRINMSIPLNIEDGVVVDRFTGVVSGVPKQVQLMTGYVSDRGLGKIPFEMYAEKDNVYKGHFNALGLFSSEHENMIVGPGVFTIILHAHTIDENGRMHKRIFHASLNIKPLIDKAEIMLQTKDKTGYIFSDMEDTDGNGRPLRIKTFDLVYPQDNPLKLTKDMVLSGGGQGFEIWQPGEDDEDQEKNPGLNPEL